MKRATGLQLITNDKFKKILKTSCTVKMDNQVDTFDDFVTVGYNEESGKTTMLQNADAVTLGKAMLMTRNAFYKSMQALTESERNDVFEVLEVD